MVQAPRPQGPQAIHEGFNPRLGHERVAGAPRRSRRAHGRARLRSAMVIPALDFEGSNGMGGDAALQHFENPSTVSNTHASPTRRSASTCSKCRVRTHRGDGSRRRQLALGWTPLLPIYEGGTFSSSIAPDAD